MVAETVQLLCAAEFGLCWTCHASENFHNAWMRLSLFNQDPNMVPTHKTHEKWKLFLLGELTPRYQDRKERQKRTRTRRLQHVMSCRFEESCLRIAQPCEQLKMTMLRKGNNGGWLEQQVWEWLSGKPDNTQLFNHLISGTENTRQHSLHRAQSHSWVDQEEVDLTDLPLGRTRVLRQKQVGMGGARLTFASPTQTCKVLVQDRRAE